MEVGGEEVGIWNREMERVEGWRDSDGKEWEKCGEVGTGEK
jgi:hypothetical protein